MMKRIVILLAAAMMAMPIFAQDQNKQNLNQPKNNDLKTTCVSQAKSKGNCKLNLTDEQKEKMEKLKADFQKEADAIRLNMDVLNAEFRKLMGADTPSEKEINAKIDQITALKGKMMKASSKHKIQMRNLLTDEQKAIFDSMHSKHGKEMKSCGQGDRHGDGCGEGHGGKCGNGCGDKCGNGCGDGHGDKCGNGCGDGHGKKMNKGKDTKCCQGTQK
jgi:Spy/CpxP family protein refolding chaperone